MADGFLPMFLSIEGGVLSQKAFCKLRMWTEALFILEVIQPAFQLGT